MSGIIWGRHHFGSCTDGSKCKEIVIYMPRKSFGAYNMSTLFVAYCSLNDIIVACKPSTTNKVRAEARSSSKFSNDKRS